MKKTVKGIHLDLNPGVFTDILTGELMAQVSYPLDREHMTNEEWQLATTKRTEDVMALSRRIFGESFMSVYEQLAKKNDGYVSAQQWTEFLNATLKEYQKNTEARSVSNSG